MNTDPGAASERRVPLDLPDDHCRLLCSIFGGALAGVTDDLKTPERMRDPQRELRRAGVYRRLIDALEEGHIDLPDEAACAEVEEVAEATDRENQHDRVVAEHDALGGLLARLGGAGPEGKV